MIITMMMIIIIMILMPMRRRRLRIRVRLTFFRQLRSWWFQVGFPLNLARYIGLKITMYILQNNTLTSPMLFYILGGWTLLRRTVIPANLTAFLAKRATISRNYTSIANYWDSFLFVSIRAIEELRQAVHFSQLRWYCYKRKQGSVFHVMTKNNSAGHSVLTYFLRRNPSHPVEACHSFDRLPDDNSTLSQNCNKWGENTTHSEINEWGSFKNKGELRLYRHASVWVDRKKSFYIYPPLGFKCDGQGGSSSISQGDKWEVYAR